MSSSCFVLEMYELKDVLHVINKILQAIQKEIFKKWVNKISRKDSLPI